MKQIIKKIMNESINEDTSPEIESMIDESERRLHGLAKSVRNILISKFRYPEDENLAIKKLEQVQSFIEQEADVFLEKVESEIGD